MGPVCPYEMLQLEGYGVENEVLKRLNQRMGRNIKFLRTKEHLTQDGLGAKVYISQPHISQYEKGQKPLTMDRISQFSEFFNVDLETFMFQELNNKVGRSDQSEPLVSGPIQKCANRTYYCYYVREHSEGGAQLRAKIDCFELKVRTPQSPHEAGVQIRIGDQSIDGQMLMDESYAYVECHDLNKDSFLSLIFYYYRQSPRKCYLGGLGMLIKSDFHPLPVSQFCVISTNAVAEEKQRELFQFLEIQRPRKRKGAGVTLGKEKLSQCQVSSDAVVRLTKKRDSKVFDWLVSNANLQR